MRTGLITSRCWLMGMLAMLLSPAAWAAAPDSASPPAIAFASDNFTLKENQRSAIISIRRSGATNPPVSVEFATADGTAVAGTDYVAKQIRVTFAAGQTKAQVKVPVIDEWEAHTNKTVKLTLSNPGDGAVLGTPSAAVLVIAENNHRQYVWASFGLDRVEPLRRPLFDIPLWQYLATLIYILLAYYASKLFDFLIHGRLKQWAEKKAPRFDHLMLALLRGPVKVVLFVILLHLGLRIFPWPDWLAEVCRTILKIVVAVSLTYVGLKLIDLVLTYWKPRALAEDKVFHDHLLPFLRNVLKVFIVVTAVLLTLSNLGLNVTSLLTSLGIGGLAIALAAQDTVANLFGAVAVLLDKPFKVGDEIKVDNASGVVEVIGLRSTRVRSPNGDLISIPNKTMGNAIITNVSVRPKIKTEFTLNLTYDTPAATVKRAVRLLNEILAAYPQITNHEIGFTKFADSSLQISVVYWWNATDAQGHAAGIQDMNLAIKERFDREGIHFAFPTRTIHTPPGSARPSSSAAVES